MKAIEKSLILTNGVPPIFSNLQLAPSQISIPRPPDAYASTLK